MNGQTSFELGAVRVTERSLVTPAGHFPLVTLGPVKLVRVEPDVGWIQLLLMAALIALGVGLRGLGLGDDGGPLFTAAGLAGIAAGVAAARRRRPHASLLAAHEGSLVEVWRTHDEAAALRLVEAVEAAQAEAGGTAILSRAAHS